MWAEIAAQREKFIGGDLQDLDPDFETAPVTTITNVSFDGVMFEVTGVDYACSLNRNYGGLKGDADGWFIAATNFGRFRFRPKPETP